MFGGQARRSTYLNRPCQRCCRQVVCKSVCNRRNPVARLCLQHNTHTNGVHDPAEETNAVDATRISFRLSPDVAAELAEQSAQTETSPNLFARELVTASLLKPAGQAHELEMLRMELARIRAAVSAANELHEEIESLPARIIDELNEGTAKTGEQRLAIDAACKHIVSLCDSVRAANEQRQQLFETLATDLAAIRSSVSLSEQQREAIVRLCDEVVGVSVEIQQIRLLRGDLATLANVLLPNAGKLTPEQTKVWMEQVYLRR